MNKNSAIEVFGWFFFPPYKVSQKHAEIYIQQATCFWLAEMLHPYIYVDIAAHLTAYFLIRGNAMSRSLCKGNCSSPASFWCGRGKDCAIWKAPTWHCHSFFNIHIWQPWPLGCGSHWFTWDGIRVMTKYFCGAQQNVAQELPLTWLMLPVV